MRPTATPVGVNTALRRLREPLAESADSPRCIKTVPRRGYRFIAPVTIVRALHPSWFPR